jgi:putative endonuclease
MVFWTYAIRSVSTDRLYIGHTMDLSKRLKEHNDPESFSSRFTKRIPGPWILVHSEPFPTRSEAYRRERWLKTGKGREYLKEILKPGC